MFAASARLWDIRRQLRSLAELAILAGMLSLVLLARLMLLASLVLLSLLSCGCERRDRKTTEIVRVPALLFRRLARGSLK